MMPLISSVSKARIVCVLTLPSEPSCNKIAVAVSSSGASAIATMSQEPIVQ
jgi:hypothetical protein